MHEHHHHHEVSRKTVTMLLVSFIINMLLSLVEFIGGIIAGSIALIGDARAFFCSFYGSSIILLIQKSMAF